MVSGWIFGIITLLFGNGLYWQSKELTLKTYQAINELMGKKLETMEKIGKYSKEYTESRELYEDTGGYKAQIEMNRIDANIKSLMENYKQFEKQQAQLENRPENIPNLDFIPPPRVTGVTVIPGEAK